MFDFSSIISSAVDATQQNMWNTINLHASKKMYQAQVEDTRENMMIAQQMDLNKFNVENAYNSPANQRFLLEQAGISPWTAFGQMAGGNSSAGGTPIPSAPGGTPARGEAQPLNLLQNMIAVKRLEGEMKALDNAIQKDAIIKEGLAMENTMKQFFIDNQMKRDFEFGGEVQAEFRAEVQRLKDRHEEFLREVNRNSERYGQEKSLWKYQTQAAIKDLEATQTKINHMNQGILNLMAEYDMIKEKIETEKVNREDIKTGTQLKEGEIWLNEFDRSYQEYLKYIRDNYGLDEKDPFYIKKIMQGTPFTKKSWTKTNEWQEQEKRQRELRLSE